MNPVEIKLKNFTSYKEETVNLEGVDIAVATGENGAGKSSLATDAITWCLFGEGSKGGKKNMNDYVRRGEQECRVELQFKLGNDLYRVVRHRSVAKDKTMLEFFVWGMDPQDGTEKWIPRSGKGIADTQEIIERTLRMDYRTFTSSSLILQGKSDSFTSDMTDAERKDALARILGLDIWDRLQEKVKAGMKQLNEKVNQFSAKKEPLQARIEDAVSTEKQLQETRKQLAECEKIIHDLQVEIDGINAQLARKKVLEEKSEELSRKRKALEDDEKKLRDEIAALNVKIAGIKYALERKKDVELAIEKEKFLAEKIAEIEKELAKKPLLEQQKDDLEKQISQAEAEMSRLKNEAANIDVELIELQDIIKRKDDILAACESEQELVAELSEHEQASKRYMELSKAMETVFKQASDWKAKHDAEIASIQTEIQAKQPLVETLERVPCSGTDKETCPLLASARSAAEDLIYLGDRLSSELAKDNPYKDHYKKLADERTRLKYDANQHAACKNLLEEVRKISSLKVKLDAAEVRKVELENRDAEIKQRMKEIEVTDDQKQKLAQLTSDISLLASKERNLPEYRQEMAEAQKLTGKKAEIDSQEALLPEMESLLANADEKLGKIISDIQAIDGQDLDVNIQIAEIDHLSDVLQEKTSQLQFFKGNESSCRTAIGGYEQYLKDAAAARKELDEIETAEKDLKSQLATYEILEKACGKKSGVPALIIENAVPEIERLANDMLNRITGGRMQLRLETQIEGKSTGVMQDVLRITIYDGGLPGPYQTFSGAERFIIDISLRVAISKFLAHRAGAEIKLLVIDEGFGSLDASGRQKILDVINAVRQDFAKVIIITHLEELKDAFPRRIEVTKGPDGSKVHVA